MGYIYIYRSLDCKFKLFLFNHELTGTKKRDPKAQGQ